MCKMRKWKALLLTSTILLGGCDLGDMLEDQGIEDNVIPTLEDINTGENLNSTNNGDSDDQNNDTPNIPDIPDIPDTTDTGNTNDTSNPGDAGDTGNTGDAGDAGDTGDTGDTGDANDTPASSLEVGEVDYIDFGESLDARGYDPSVLEAIDPLDLVPAGTENTPEAIAEALIQNDEIKKMGEVSSFLNLTAPALAINAHKLYAEGYTGKGIVIGMSDGAVNFNHSDLVGKQVGTAEQLANRLQGTDEQVGHGTAVASVMVGNRDDQGIMGIAHGAGLIEHGIITPSGSIQISTLIQGYDEMVNTFGARILNNSWGSSDALYSFYDAQLGRTTIDLGNNFANTVAATMAKGVVYVWAAGNSCFNTVSGSTCRESGTPNVNITSPYANMPHQYADWIGHWINVIALEEAAIGGAGSGNFTIANYSNACGASKDWCIGAPGNMVVADSSNEAAGTGYVQGTSLAAPTVSASIALLMQRFPELTTPSIVAALFNGATDLGDPGIDEVYGHGLVNLEASVHSVLSSTVTSIQGGTSSISASSLQINEAVSSQVQAALAGLTIANKQGHQYEVNADTLIKESRRKLSMEGKTGLDYMQETRRVTLPGDMTGQFGLKGYYNEHAKSMSNQDVIFNLDSDITETSSLSLRRGREMGDALGVLSFAEDHMTDHEIKASSVAHPYLTLVDPEIGAGLNWSLSEETTISGGSFFGHSQSLYDFHNATQTSSNEPSQEQTKITGGYLGLSHAYNIFDVMGGNLQLNTGYMREEKGLFGHYNQGSLALADQSDTGFAGLSLSLDVSKNWTLLGQANFGNSLIENEATSLFQSEGPIISGAYHFGLQGQDIFLKQDRLKLMAGAPLHVIHGRMDLNVPVGLDQKGAMTYREHSIDLASGDVPIEVSAQYSMNILDKGELLLGGQAIRDEVGDYGFAVISGLKYRF